MQQDAPKEAHYELIESLRAKSLLHERKLAETQTLAEGLSKDLQKTILPLVEGLQKNISYYSGVLKLLEQNFSTESDWSEDKNPEDIKDSNSIGEEKKTEFPCTESLDQQREPKEMLRPAYKNMSMGEIIESILKTRSSPFTSEELAEIVYDTQNEDEFFRAKASISAQLRLGAKNQKWKKTDRGLFQMVVDW